MIKLINISKSFNNEAIYQNLNYEINAQGLTCFYGPSGSGKTTLFNLIAGFDYQYSGEILINHQALRELSQDQLAEYRFNQVGFVFQQYHLLGGYTALENVMLASQLNPELTEAEIEKQATNYLKQVGLENHMNKSMSQLSGGQKQRVAIARALMNNPSIILADEPTGALDEDSTKQIMAILKEIAKTKTVVMITHDENMNDYADEIIALENQSVSVVKKENERAQVKTQPKLSSLKLTNKVANKMSMKNFKYQLFKYLFAALVVACGSAAFIGTFATTSITEKLMADFEAKNFFYNIVQLPVNQETADDVMSQLLENEKVNEPYLQYNIEQLSLTYNDTKFVIEQETPTIMSKESLSYGDMPKSDKQEIALPLNVVNQFGVNVTDILGKTLVLGYVTEEGTEKTIEVTVSGITNSQYQDVIISSTLEQQIYEEIKLGEPKMMTFTVNQFDDVSSVVQQLQSDEQLVYSRESEIIAFETSFASLLSLYQLLSYFILGIGLTMSGVILYKMSSSRSREVGILSALGFRKKDMNRILNYECLYFVVISSVFSCIVLVMIDQLYQFQFGYGINLTMINFMMVILLTSSISGGLLKIMYGSLMRLQPAKALRL